MAKKKAIAIDGDMQEPVAEAPVADVDGADKKKEKRLFAKRSTTDPNKPVVHYINNKEFYAEMVEFRAANLDRVAAGQRPIVPNKIGEKILKICERLSRRYNFSVYSFRQEMVDDAILNCINYIWNFDPAKSTNPFSYFTIVAQRAFIRRIQKEKKQSETKKRYAEYVVDSYITTEFDAPKKTEFQASVGKLDKEERELFSKGSSHESDYDSAEG